jgi:hypothetical protein
MRRRFHATIHQVWIKQLWIHDSYTWSLRALYVSDFLLCCTTAVLLPFFLSHTVVFEVSVRRRRFITGESSRVPLESCSKLRVISFYNGSCSSVPSARDATRRW